MASSKKLSRRLTPPYLGKIMSDFLILLRGSILLIVVFVIDSHTANVQIEFFEDLHHELFRIRLKIELHFPLWRGGWGVPIHHSHLVKVYELFSGLFDDIQDLEFQGCTITPDGVFLTTVLFFPLKPKSAAG